MGQTQQLYGRNDMVMLDQQDKIYGSLGMHESYLLNSLKGNPLVMTNSRDGTFGKEVTDLKLYGWSKQERTTGAQLFELTNNYIWAYFTTGNTKINTYLTNALIYIPCEPNTTYTISGYKNTSNTINVGTSVEFPSVGITLQNIIDKKGITTYTTSDDAKYLCVFILNDKDGVTVDNREEVLKSIVANLMINKGSIALPYESYTSGQSSPSPDYPQKIVSAGMKWSHGKNLFDISKADIGETTSWGATTGTALSIATAKYCCLTIIDVLPNTTYTVRNFTPENIWISRIIEADEDGLGYVNHRHYNSYADALIQKTFKTSANTTKLYMSMSSVDGKTDMTESLLANVKVMVAKNSEIEEYEPYDGGISILYSDDINVVVRGKNLIDFTKSPDVHGTYQGWKIPKEDDEYATITIVDKGNDENINSCYFGVTDNGINASSTCEWIIENAKIKKETIKTKLKYISCYPYGAMEKILKRFDIQVEIGVEPTFYEPYHEPQSVSVDTTASLSAIPVLSGGNYTDESGQQWIADYIDFASGKYVQMLKHMILDETMTYVYSSNSRKEYYRVYVSQRESIDLLKNSPAYCEELNGFKNILGNDVEGIFVTNTIDIQIANERLSEVSVSGVKKFLSNNPLHCVFALAVPIEHDLTPEEIENYKALTTYSGTTIVENDAECYMEATYKASGNQ